MTIAWPTGSRRRGCGARGSGTSRAVSSRARIPIGTLTRKTHRHPPESTSAPPTTGPSTMLIPTTPAHTPIACARSWASSNTLRMIDIATGLSIDPPIAWSTRAATSAPRLGASAHSSEARENTARPTWNTRLRPMRSAVDPASISSEASTSVYASIVHWRPEKEPCSERWIAGSATFTIVVSRLTIRMLMQHVTRTRSLCRRSSASVPTSIRATRATSSAPWMLGGCAATRSPNRPRSQARLAGKGALPDEPLLLQVLRRHLRRLLLVQVHAGVQLLHGRYGQRLLHPLDHLAALRSDAFQRVVPDAD